MKSLFFILNFTLSVLGVMQPRSHSPNRRELRAASKTTSTCKLSTLLTTIMPTSTIWEPFTVTITVTTSLPTPPPSTSTTSSPTPSSTPSPSSSSTTCPRQTLTLTAPPKTTTTTYTTILTSTTSIFNFTADCVGQTCQTPYTLYPCPDTSLDSCYCGFDSSGYSYCFVNDFCQNQTDCSFNEDCKEGERCVVASCCGVGKCTKTAMGRCVNPASVVVESLEGVIEGVNAVRNGCSNVNPGGCE